LSRPGPAYKAVIFDLGNVLVHFDFRRAYEALERLGPYRAAEIPARLAPTGLVQRLETGLVEPREFVAELARVLDLRIGYDEFRRIWFSIFSDALVPESMLVGLKARYRLLLLSNTNALHFEMLGEHYPLLRHFDHLILSYEVKAMKPQPQIFQAAVALAGCLPEE
jgi:putative hydrolase of the HAD superfamily